MITATPQGSFYLAVLGGDGVVTVKSSSQLCHDRVSSLVSTTAAAKSTVFQHLVRGEPLGTPISSLWDWFYALPFNLRALVDLGDDKYTVPGVSYKHYSYEYNPFMFGKHLLHLLLGVADSRHMIEWQRSMDPDNRVEAGGDKPSTPGRRRSTIGRDRPEDMSKAACLVRYLLFTQTRDCASGFLGKCCLTV